MSEAEQEQLGEVALPVTWHFPEGIRSRYANSLLVRAGLYEITVYFFEIQQLDPLGLSDEDKEEQKKSGPTRVECISKVIVRPDLVPTLIDTLETRPESRHRLENVPVPTDWPVSEGTQSRYANNVIVQSGPYEVVISFFEVQLPFLFGSPEENKRQVEKLGSVRAECVSKVSIPPELVPFLINALKTALSDSRQSRDH